MTSPSHWTGSSEAMEREEAREEEMRLKAALHYAVGKTCEKFTKADHPHLDDSTDSRPDFSNKFVSALAEATWQLTQTYARDLDAFSKHAKRQTANIDDVKLIARHNPDLATIFNVKTAELVASKPKRKVTAQGGGPSKKAKT